MTEHVSGCPYCETESLEEEVERLTTEGGLKDELIAAFQHYRMVVEIGSAEAIGQAEDDINDAIDAVSGRHDV